VQSVQAGIQISILDPEAMFSVVDPKTQALMADLPQQVKSRLQAALDALAAV
jgi:hypothetical protein